MAEGFVSLARWLEPAPVAGDDALETIAPVGEEETRERAEVDALLSEVRRFRAALSAAVDASCESLARDIAAEVVGRELELRDADIRAIVRRACERYSIDAPIAIRVHPAEASSVRLLYPVVEDASLRRGDAVVEIASGSIDARLGVRLDRVLRALA